MAEAKTKPTKQSVEKFIKSLPDDQAREDCLTIAILMQQATRAGRRWGSSIVGFGLRTIKYAGGREGLVNQIFRATEPYLTLWGNRIQPMKKLKHTVGKGCLYIKRLSDVDHRAEEGYSGSGERKTAWRPPETVVPIRSDRAACGLCQPDAESSGSSMDCRLRRRCESSSRSTAA